MTTPWLRCEAFGSRRPSVCGSPNWEATRDLWARRLQTRDFKPAENTTMWTREASESSEEKGPRRRRPFLGELCASTGEANSQRPQPSPRRDGKAKHSRRHLCALRARKARLAERLCCLPSAASAEHPLNTSSACSSQGEPNTISLKNKVRVGDLPLLQRSQRHVARLFKFLECGGRGASLWA